MEQDTLQLSHIIWISFVLAFFQLAKNKATNFKANVLFADKFLLTTSFTFLLTLAMTK